MTVLRSVDFFSRGGFPVAIEPRRPQRAYPEHHHDFHEIVLVEQGAGVHVFNDQPQALSAGCVCFIRDSDRHLYEQTENLCLTNVLYRREAFRFLNGLADWLPQDDERYRPHWRVSNPVLRQTKQLIDQMAALTRCNTPENQAWQETLFLQLLICLRRGGQAVQNSTDADSRLQRLLEWLNNNYGEAVDWARLADHFALPLRTLHRQLKQQTGSTPQRYLTHLRLLQARHLLRHSETRITDIAFACGFGDSNHFSTLFRREFGYAPRMERQLLRHAETNNVGCQDNHHAAEQ